MATKIITLSNPSVSFTNTIDWLLGEIFEASVSFNNININFINENEGKRIFVKLVNSSISSINITWPPNTKALNSIPSNTIVVLSLIKIGNFIYGSLESSASYGFLYTVNSNLTIPANITTIYATIIPSTGGGGVGATGFQIIGGGTLYGGGGGGGGYAPNQVRVPLSVTPGLTYSINIGAAGAGATSGTSATSRNGNDGSDGGATTITQGATTLISVLGGTGGKGGKYVIPGVNPVGGAGGQLGGSAGNGSSAGAGGVNPDRTTSKGGDGGNGSGTGAYTAGSQGTSAVVLITYT